LIKDAQALELAHKIDTIVFDKTGTLTKGNPEVTDFEMANNQDKMTLLRYAYAIENLSEHPISIAIAEYADKHIDNNVNLEVSKFEAIEGKGVKGEVHNVKILLGNQRLINEQKVQLNNNLEQKANELINQGKTTIYMSVDGKQVAIFALADTIKEESKLAVDKLHNIGIKVVMLTGDNQKTAESIAQQLDIDDVAEVLPGDKSDKIKKLQSENGDSVVAMVGDGINDAPALAQSDIGIAMGTGTDVAIEAGNIVLVKGTLDKVIETIDLSKETLKVIKQNLFWAFGYNVIAIPIAAGILYPITGLVLSPIIASAAMAFSSVTVVLNSLRLKSS